MVSRINFALNEKTYRKVFNLLKKNCWKSEITDISLIEKCLYLCYLMNTETLEGRYKGKTRMDVLLELEGKSLESFLIDFYRRFNEFKSNNVNNRNH